MSRPRVAHVCTIDLSLRYLLFGQLKFLQERGFDVVAVSNPGPDVAFLQQHGIRHIAVKMTRTFSPVRDAEALLDLRRVFQRERFDIVHTHNPKPGLLGQLAAGLAGVPVVVNTLHGFYFHDHMRPLLRRFFILMEQVAAANSDHILSQNPEDIRTAIAEHIAPTSKLELLGNGIDLRRFSRAAVADDDVDAVKAELGISRDDVVVGFVGRLVEEKGILELFEAVRLLRATHPRVKLLVIGPTDTEKSDALSPEKAKDYGLDDVCVFAGLRQDMPRLYAAMDVFVLPSHREGFPRSPMEAAAMGRPVVATDIRGCREVVVDGVTGSLVPLKDPRALALSIGALLDDKARAREMGIEGRALAERKFDERLVFEKVAATYERLLRRRRRA
ncbi:MAG: glycosyltransferase family 4 protein [Deltaproteobacteria bacterium]|nr:glycosyltransferase family 4 protein [Deltaproteobacteria bacterium]